MGSYTASIAKAANTRPIYRSETDVKTMIRSKPNLPNEAYCVVRILREDIARPFTGVNPRDRLGHELLVLKERAINQKMFYVLSTRACRTNTSRVVCSSKLNSV